jgi:energy-coupling factor transport system permease protein
MNANIWMVWLVAVMTITLSTRNPVYLVFLLGSLLCLGHRLARDKKNSSWLLSNIQFVLTMILLSTLINMLFSHVGSTVLFTIPTAWPLIGGNITLESLVYGAINGLVIGVLYLLFNIINLALSIKQITRLIPRAFHPVAMVVTIALTFFPSIQQRTQEIKEAQIIRGNPMKKIADWLPILMPLLVSSLENAFQLAESMTARGFHKQSPAKSSLALISLVFAAFAVFSGWMLQIYQYPRALYGFLYLVGFGLTAFTLISVGRQSNITRYHQEPWQQVDLILAVVLVLAIVSFGFLTLSERLLSLYFSPYPHLSLPSLQVFGIALSLLPLLPALVIRHA